MHLEPRGLDLQALGGEGTLPGAMGQVHDVTRLCTAALDGEGQLGLFHGLTLDFQSLLRQPQRQFLRRRGITQGAGLVQWGLCLAQGRRIRARRIRLSDRDRPRLAHPDTALFQVPCQVFVVSATARKIR